MKLNTVKKQPISSSLVIMDKELQQIFTSAPFYISFVDTEMRERVESYGGKLTVIAGPEGGTIIAAEVRI